jgi:predicted DNA-binding transcriptional regulator AlpA
MAESSNSRVRLIKQHYDMAIRYFAKAAMAKPSPRNGAVLKAASQLHSGERLLTPKEAANLLRLSTSWLAKARMRGDGPPYTKLGRSIRYPEGALLQWMKSHLRLSTSER